MGREEYRTLVADAQKIVVKVGTSTLTHSNGKLNLEQIERLVRQLSDLRNQGKDVVSFTPALPTCTIGSIVFARLLKNRFSFPVSMFLIPLIFIGILLIVFIFFS